MSRMSQWERKRLVDFLTQLPEMASQRSRQHLLIDAGLDKWVERLNLSDPAAIAASEIVVNLSKFAAADEWVTFLRAIRECVGADWHAFFDKLIAQSGAIAHDVAAMPEETSEVLTLRNRNQKKIVVFGAVAALGGAIVFFVLSQISNQFLDAGWKRREKGDLKGARERLEWAIALNPGNAEARYKLAFLYEKLDRSQRAQELYRQLLEEVPQAYNNLARLYIREQKYTEAKELLLRGLQQGSNKLPQAAKYSFNKNLGWVYFELERHQEAEQELKIAIGILERIPFPSKEWDNIAAKGAAYCFQAEILERKEDVESLQQSLPMWAKCCQLGSRTNPDEEPWLKKANERAKGLCKPSSKQSFRETKFAKWRPHAK